jgi:hypothetical protein
MIFVTINIHSIQNIKNKVTDFFCFPAKKLVCIINHDGFHL